MINENLPSNFSQCLISKDSIVLGQNKRCAVVCGDMIGKLCTKGCQQYLSNLDFEGDIYLKNRKVHNDICNISAYKEEGSILINIFKTKEELTIYQEDELTSKEKQVAELVFSGLKNTDIQEKLKISKSTLKTHLNHIYQKLGDEFKKLRPSIQ